MTNHWSENSERNLFSKSENKSDFNSAREEWLVTGIVIDNYEDMDFDEDPPDVACELCNHDQIRWQFQIRNEKNSNIMLVGSSCIEKFNINYFKDGRLLSPEERDSLLDKQIRDIVAEKKYEQGLTALRLLWKKHEDKRTIVGNWGRHFKELKNLTPMMAVYTSRWMDEAGVEFQHSWYKVTLKHENAKRDIGRMNAADYELLIPFLTQQQKDSCEKIRSRKNKSLF